MLSRRMWANFQSRVLGRFRTVIPGKLQVTMFKNSLHFTAIGKESILCGKTRILKIVEITPQWKCYFYYLLAVFLFIKSW